VLVPVLAVSVLRDFLESARAEAMTPSCAAATLMTAALKNRRRSNLISSEFRFVFTIAPLYTPSSAADISEKLCGPAQGSRFPSGKRVKELDRKLLNELAADSSVRLDLLLSRDDCVATPFSANRRTSILKLKRAPASTGEHYCPLAATRWSASRCSCRNR
jgi:hypothetical protein